ncbi:MAG: AAA family ATPase [Rhodobacteraceae bacterium]|nr:AAA family ATPase [Paracoccaceae bacterium]
MSWANGSEPIGRGDVLVVDEAGMIGTWQMDRVAAKMREIGAKLVLVGDPEQLQPIEARTLFRGLVADHPAARLTEIHRQREDWQRTASRDLAEGRMAEAESAYADHGALRPAATRDEAIEALAETYAMDAAANGADKSRLAFTHRRRDVHALNQAIRETLRPADQPREEVPLHTETGPRAFDAGDRLVFGRNDRELGVKNGMLGDVVAVSHEEMTVALDGDAPRQVTFDPRSYRHFDHGYTVTIHKSQGATVDQAYVLASGSMDHQLTYVAMTRHRDALTVFTSDADRPRWAQSQPEPSRARARARDGPAMG